MGKIAIVTDSTAYLSIEEREQYNITMVPLNVVMGDESWKEEEDLTTDTFYQEMKTTDKLPSTSQPAIGEFAEVYQALAEKGYDEIISIHLSSAISGTYQSAMAAANMVENAQVYGFDSEISCAPQGYYVIEAAKLALQGKSVSDILARLEEMKHSVKAYFMVDNLQHLHRGGRLNAAQLVVGSLLKIKPVLQFQDKVIVPFEKVRTEKKALTRILDLLEEDAGANQPIVVTVIHANRKDKAEELAEQIRSTHPQANVSISYFGPVIGTHLGEGSIGISWYKPA